MTSSNRVDFRSVGCHFGCQFLVSPHGRTHRLGRCACRRRVSVVARALLGLVPACTRWWRVRTRSPAAASTRWRPYSAPPLGRDVWPAAAPESSSAVVAVHGVDADRVAVGAAGDGAGVLRCALRHSALKHTSRHPAACAFGLRFPDARSSDWSCTAPPSLPLGARPGWTTPLPTVGMTNAVSGQCEQPARNALRSGARRGPRHRVPGLPARGRRDAVRGPRRSGHLGGVSGSEVTTEFDAGRVETSDRRSRPGPMSHQVVAAID